MVGIWGVFCVSGIVFQRDTQEISHGAQETHGDSYREEGGCHFRGSSGSYYLQEACEHMTEYVLCS